jgi:hypothetical protein
MKAGKLLLALAVGASACSSAAPADSVRLDVVRSVSVNDQVLDLTLTSNGALYLSVVEEGRSKLEPDTFWIWRVAADSPTPQRVDLPADPRCRLLDYSHPSRLADGRIGLVKECTLPPGELTAEVTAVAYDPVSEQLESFASLGPAGRRRRYGGVLEQDQAPDTIAWTPDLTRAVVGEGSGICGWIATVTETGKTAFPVTVSEGDRSWRVDAGFRGDVSNPCTNDGWAGSPSWSPDFRQVAFAASPQAAGIEGVARMEQPTNIYVNTLGESSAQLVASDLDAFGDLRWAPKGDILALIATRNGHTGVWFLEVDTGAWRQTSITGTPRRLDWSPDGHHLAVLTQTGKTSSIEIVKVP